MKRRALNIAAVTGIALCVALLLLRAAGGWSDPTGRTHALPARWSFTADAAHGQLQLVLFHDAQTFTYGPPLPSTPAARLAAWVAWNTAHPQLASFHGHGFIFSLGPIITTDAAHRLVITGTRTWLLIPYWSAELTLLLPTLLLLARHLLRRRPPAPGLCPTCGYDLRATPTQCPECGAVPIHAGAERSGTPRSAAPDSSIRPVCLVLVVLLFASSTRAAAPADTTLYSPDPTHPWNRLHAALFLRTAPTGETFGLDSLDPLLWSGTRHHLLEGNSHASALAALDAALAAPMVQDPIKRALLQRDLWSAFDWSANRDTDAARALRTRLAALLRHIALTADEIRALPDIYAAVVAAHRYPTDDDPAHPDTPFLPPDLFHPAGPWIPLRYSGNDGDDGDDGTAAPVHSHDFGDRSVFEPYFRHPAGRQAGLDYLARLAAYTREHPNAVTGFPTESTLDPNLPQLPAGATFALVRRALLFDRTGRLRPTRLIESVQLRIYRHNGPSTRARPAQSVHEFQLSRAAAVADPSAGLRAIGPGERDVPSPLFRSHGIDPFEFGGVRPQPHSYTVSTLDTCRDCHDSPGIQSVHTFTRFFPEPRPARPALAESPPDLQPSLAIRRKQSRPEWKLLRDLLTTPNP